MKLGKPLRAHAMFVWHHAKGPKLWKQIEENGVRGRWGLCNQAQKLGMLEYPFRRNLMALFLAGLCGSGIHDLKTLPASGPLRRPLANVRIPRT